MAKPISISDDQWINFLVDNKKPVYENVKIFNSISISIISPFGSNFLKSNFL